MRASVKHQFIRFSSVVAVVWRDGVALRRCGVRVVVQSVALTADAPTGTAVMLYTVALDAVQFCNGEASEGPTLRLASARALTCRKVWLYFGA